MQRYKIVHRTYYNFSQPVELGPHDLRLRPRENHALHVEGFNIKIDPPANILWHLDVEENSVAIATFDSPTSFLAIESEAIIQQFNEMPLNFLVADDAVNYPFSYSDDDAILLSPHIALPTPEASTQLAEWTKGIYQSGEQLETYTLLQRLCTHIHQTMTYQIREEPGVQSASRTLAKQTGSCRDFAELFIQASRYLGLAARFVSGYLDSTPSATDFGATHAWAEVYLPGAGWKGFDPTTGNIVGPDHIAVAVSRAPESVPPIAGSFFGNASSTMDVGVWVTKL